MAEDTYFDGTHRPLSVDGSLTTSSASEANAGSDATKAVAVQGVTGGKAVPTAIATVAAPTYIEGSSDPLSVDLTGGLRVTSATLATAANQSTMNTNLTRVQGADGATAPSFGVMGGGFDGTNLQYLLTDTTGRQVVVGAQTNGGSIGTTMFTVGGSDGTLGRIFSTSASGVLNVSATGQGASGATASGNPVGVGGVYTSAGITLATGQRGDVQLDSRGSMLANIYAPPVAAADANANSTSARFFNGVSTGTQLEVRSFAFNGTSWDRPRTIQGAATANTGLGVTAVEEAGRTFSNITTATTTTIKSGAGFLHTLVVNTTVASGVITIYDSTTGSGTKIATITNPITLLQMGPLTATYDLAFSTGLTIVTTGAQDITVTYR